jgi:acyl phosphate:glycerol-3-phosphate acyltransferase
MMDVLFIIGGLIIAYLVGSIPTAVWYSRAFFGMDVREFGSGNAGATNTLRVLGKKAGAIVMAIDVLKGFLATNGASILVGLNAISADNLELWKLLFGFAAALGHIFPAYAGFRGGKGVATLLGMVLAINLLIALICIAVFFIVLIVSRYVSLGSMLAALAFPIAMLIPRFSPHEPITLIFAFALASIVVLTHQKNIKRLLAGEENKTRILKKSRES